MRSGNSKSLEGVLTGKGENMVTVILRNGKVLQYNTATTISIETGTITLGRGDERWLVARIPMDIVERAEFNKPLIYREPRKDKLPIRR